MAIFLQARARDEEADEEMSDVGSISDNEQAADEMES